MNIVCLVKSLYVENNNLYLKLKQLLGDQITKEISIRTNTIHFKVGRVIFVTCQQEICQISGINIDIAIVADQDITEEWKDFLYNRVLVSKGIILKDIS